MFCRERFHEHDTWGMSHKPLFRSDKLFSAVNSSMVESIWSRRRQSARTDDDDVVRGEESAAACRARVKQVW